MPAFLTIMLLAFIANTPPSILPPEDTTIIIATTPHYTLSQNLVNTREFYWNHPTPSAIYLTINATHQTTKIAESTQSLFLHTSLSPTEKFITWYDTFQKCIYLYNTTTHTTQKLPKKFQSLPHWLPNDDTFITYDAYDPYKITTSTITCLTHHYGKKHHITFRLLDDSILVAFNPTNKQNGFYKLTSQKPERLTMNNTLYYFPTYPLDEFKPKHTDSTWLLQKQDAANPPISLTTTDFKTFIKKDTTSTSPTLTATLLHFHGITGILYKPIDFNPNKKYPLILTYYQISSNNLHKYLPLQNSEATLNIPTYISNGYIVFVPDVKTKKGNPGPSTAKTVIKSAKKLRKYKWIDKQHIGLQGHSFGGYITNFVITRSKHLFAAAQSSAAPVNFISGYGSVKKGTNISLQPLYERGQNNMGTTPWDNPKGYFRNSPIFKVHHIQTPLLIIHNEDDYIVPYAQAMELFMALRRLQKPIWWLQYRDEGHQLFKRENQADFSAKQLDFFNHFLKGSPAPAWMSQSQPCLEN